MGTRIVLLSEKMFDYEKCYKHLQGEKLTKNELKLRLIWLMKVEDSWGASCLHEFSCSEELDYLSVITVVDVATLANIICNSVHDGVGYLDNSYAFVIDFEEEE